MHHCTCANASIYTPGRLESESVFLCALRALHAVGWHSALSFLA